MEEKEKKEGATKEEEEGYNQYSPGFQPVRLDDHFVQYPNQLWPTPEE